MTIMIPFPGGSNEPTMTQLIESDARIMYAELGADSLAAARHEQRMYVGLSYISEFLANNRNQGTRLSAPLKPSDIVDLDPEAVAAGVAGDLGCEGKTRVARTIEILIAHARRFLDSRPTPPAASMSELERQIKDLVKWKLVRLTQESKGEGSYVIRGTINIDLTVHRVHAESKRAA
jgi:hypothetical protein